MNRQPEPLQPEGTLTRDREPEVEATISSMKQPFEVVRQREVKRVRGHLGQLSYALLAGHRPRQAVAHSLRTAVAAIVSLAVARLFGLPEAYWAPVTTLVITQSSLRETLSVSWHRFFGTALGALVGAIVASQIGANTLVFGAGVFILGLTCALAGSDRTAYRFGAVTLAIVLLVPRTYSAWHVAFHRFAEVSIGIGVALVLTILWPESTDSPAH